MVLDHEFIYTLKETPARFTSSFRQTVNAGHQAGSELIASGTDPSTNKRMDMICET